MAAYGATAVVRDQLGLLIGSSCPDPDCFCGGGMIKNAPAAVISRQTLLLLYRRFFLPCWFDALQRIAACVPSRLLPHRGIARARRMVASPHAHAHSALPTYQYGTGARIAPAAAAAAGPARRSRPDARHPAARAPPLSSRPAPAVAPSRGLSQQAEGEDVKKSLRR